MNQLQRLGLRDLWIYEALVSTFHDGAPHVAPIGVWTDGAGELLLDAYKGSRTLANLLETGDFTANFPVDADALYIALRAPEQLAFTAARSVQAPIVARCAATLEVRVNRTIDAGDTVRVMGAVEHVHHSGLPRLINRAEGLLLESLVLVTRLERAAPADVLATLTENLRVVSKVAPGSSYQHALDALVREVGARS